MYPLAFATCTDVTLTTAVHLRSSWQKFASSKIISTRIRYSSDRYSVDVDGQALEWRHQVVILEKCPLELVVPRKGAYELLNSDDHKAERISENFWMLPRLHRVERLSVYMLLLCFFFQVKNSISIDR